MYGVCVCVCVVCVWRVYPWFRAALGQMSNLVAVDAGDILICVVPGRHPAEWLILISVRDLGLGHTEQCFIQHVVYLHI